MKLFNKLYIYPPKEKKKCLFKKYQMIVRQSARITGMDSCLVFQGINYLFFMEKNVGKVRSKHLHATAHLSSTNEVNDALSICAERLRPILTIPIVQDLLFWKVS